MKTIETELIKITCYSAFALQVWGLISLLLIPITISILIFISGMAVIMTIYVYHCFKLATDENLPSIINEYLKKRGCD